MAFNPFDLFRRNQRILFAIITIFVMIMFTFSWGQNDFFSWLPRYLGSMQASGEIMAVIDGRKIYESDLSRLQGQRVIADQFMRAASFPVRERQAQIADSLKAKMSQENKNTVETALMFRSFLGNPQMAQFSGQVMQQLAQSEPALARIMEDAKATPEDKEAASAMLRTLTLDRQLSTPNQSFFASAPNRSKKDQVDFYLWLAKADELGIKFTDEELLRLIEDDLPSLTVQDRELIFKDFSKTRINANKSQILQALNQEYRVRAAQVAVLGGSYIRGFSAGASAPYDMYSIYRKDTATHRYGFISLPAEAFLPQVTGTPTDSELRTIFNKTKSVEPEPASPLYGIKEPRKLKLQWLNVTGNEPFYKTAAEKRLPLANAFAVLSGPFSELLAPTPLSGVVSAYTLSLKEPMYDSAYAAYRDTHNGDIGFRWYQQLDTNLSLLDTTVAQTQHLGSLTAVLGGSLATGAPAIGAPLAMIEQAARTERHQRLQAGLALLTPPALGSIAEFAAVANSHTALIPQPLPLTVVRSTLAESVREKLKFSVAQEDLIKFRDDLAKLTELKKDKAAEAQKMVQDFVTSRGATTGQSVNFADQYTIHEDPGLAKLNELLNSPHAGLGNKAKFGRRFFFTEPFTNPQTGEMLVPERPTVGFYDPQPFPNREINGPTAFSSQMIVWRTDEEPAKSPESFAAAREKCISVWKLQKAREIAQTTAYQLAEQLKNAGDNQVAISQKLAQTRSDLVQKLGPTAEFKVKNFEIDGVAQIVIEPGLGSPPTITANPFNLVANDNIPYPNSRMQAELLAMNEKPVGSTGVLTDNTERTFYVAVQLLSRKPGEKQFQEHVFPAADARNTAQTIIQRLYIRKTAIDTREEALALLRSEFNYRDENPRVNEKTDNE